VTALTCLKVNLAKDEAAKIRDGREKYTKDRYDGFVQRV
jgi:hypothetical protein